MDAFHAKIREKIADESLQAALDANAENRTRSRQAAWASLPDIQERRQRAHALRAEVIARLDEYLEQFTQAAQANGISVHRAPDAAAAVQIVLDIAAASGKAPGTPLLFAKAKSMVSEEIGLNHALAAAGQRVVETDLGEYIVQLRGERPGHILTPAVHLRRHQVGQLFHEKLGIPYTEDIPTLVGAARQALRQVFLSADIGLSGVNFGIAETGTLALVSNEGNARMCTTLPPVHIALMGMERLLPTLNDLALLISLLPRSATGQKISVYTQLIQRPLPGQQRHIILLDNGRTALRASPLAESLYCIRCGACLNACPVFREIGGHGYVSANGQPAAYPGPIGSVISPGLAGGSEFGQLAQASSLCGACRDACPVAIDLPKLLLRIRAGEIRQDETGKFSSAPGLGLPPTLNLGLKLFSRAAAHPRLYAFAQKFLGLMSLPLPAYLPLPALTGWGASKDFLKPAAKPFRARRTEQTYPAAAPILRPNTPPASQPIAAAPVPTDRCGQFIRELSAFGGQVTRLPAEELPQALTSLLNRRGIQSVEMWESIPGLDADQLTKAGIRVEKSAPEAAAGLTGALCAIAETGSLIVHSGNGRPLTASLVPPIHLAVLRASQILPTLESALRLPEVVDSAACAIITGPSRTADIEMTLTIGAHGPGEVHVFLVDDAPCQ